MTPPEFVAIFTSQKRLCLTIIVGTLLLSIAFYRLQSQTYTASLVLSVTRSNAQDAVDYRYDHFYRLQADERFADTLVRYLGTEQGKREIALRASLSPAEASYFLAEKIKAARLSSQLITVTVLTKTVRGGERLAEALPEALNQYASDLNREARDPNWFLVIASEPVIADARFNWREALVVGFLVGLFLAFWTALGGHYWRHTSDGDASR